MKERIEKCIEAITGLAEYFFVSGQIDIAQAANLLPLTDIAELMIKANDKFQKVMEET